MNYFEIIICLYDIIKRSSFIYLCDILNISRDGISQSKIFGS